MSIKRLSAFGDSCLMYILRIRLVDKILYGRFHYHSNTFCINSTIIEPRFRLQARLLTRLNILLAKPCDGWHQKQGGPIKIWTDMVRKDYERIDGSTI